MLQSDFLEVIKQGRIEAISTVINQELQPKKIIAKVKLNDSCLQIILESSQAPEQKAAVAIITKIMIHLEITFINTVKLYGRKTGDKFLAWRQEIEILSSNISQLEKNSSQSSTSKIEATPEKVSQFPAQLPSKTNHLKTNRDLQKTVIMGTFIASGMICASVVVGFFLSKSTQLSPKSPLVQQSLVPEHSSNPSIPQLQASEETVQNQNISGKWVGVLSQSAGGVASKYKYEMLLSQNGQSVEGITREEIVENPQIYGVIRVRGSTSGNVFRFEDVGVVETSIPGSIWCIKNGTLQYTFSGGVESLSGAWKGRDNCPPGEIYLEKQAN